MARSGAVRILQSPKRFRKMSSYQVLARKWRPHDFESIVGQDHVVTALTRALTEGRLHHAYLFTGTRGVGKTTISRIFAKALNCQGADGKGGVTAHPCGVCEACRAIDEGRFVDYIEMDAASNRSVEDMTQLRRAARICEVHSGDDGSAEGAGDGVVALFTVHAAQHDAGGHCRASGIYSRKGRHRIRAPWTAAHR